MALGSARLEYCIPLLNNLYDCKKIKPFEKKWFSYTFDPLMRLFVMGEMSNVSLIIKLVNDTPHHHMSRDVTSLSPVTRHTPEYGGGDSVADVTLGCLMSRWLLPAVQSPVPGVMWHWADLALAEWCRGSVEARAQTPEFGLVRTESVTGSASGGCVEHQAAARLTTQTRDLVRGLRLLSSQSKHYGCKQH